MSQLVTLVNDSPCGVMYVAKNEIKICFTGQEPYSFRIDTKKLLDILEKEKPPKVWRTRKFSIEPSYIDPEGARLTIITICYSSRKCDCDRATVYQNDLREALMAIESPDLLNIDFKF